MQKILIIGAGKQGRGILAYISYINSLYPVFIDQDEDLIHRMRSKKTYQIKRMQDDDYISLPCADCVYSEDLQAVCTAIQEADIIFTSVSPNQVYPVGMMIGKALQYVVRKEDFQTKNIILCENSNDKIAQFKRGLRETLEEEMRLMIEDKVGICEALSMSLATQSSVHKDELLICIQQKMHLYINKNQMKGDLPRRKAIRYVDNYESLRQQALYTNNTSSAFVSYLGHLKGYQTLKQAMKDNQIRELLDMCYSEINLTLIKELGVSPSDQKEFAEFARKKYENSEDSLDRHAREVIRKLGREERLTGICERSIRNNIMPQTISLALAAALFYRNEQDEESSKLAKLCKDDSLKSILLQVCGIEQNDMLVDMVRNNITWLVENQYLCHDEIVTKLVQS